MNSVYEFIMSMRLIAVEHFNIYPSVETGEQGLQGISYLAEKRNGLGE